MPNSSIVWFRQDLRLDDQPALRAAMDSGGPVIPVYIWSPEAEGKWAPGAASRWWLHHSLIRLDEQLRSIGSQLVIRRGDAHRELSSLAAELGATGIFWTRRYEPAAIERDKRVKMELRKQGLRAESDNGQLLFEPWDVKTNDGRPYQVYTAFWKSCLARSAPAAPIPCSGQLTAPEHWPRSLNVSDLKLLPRIPWDAGLAKAWIPGAKSASQELKQFITSAVRTYDVARDLPAERGTSRLSPHLHFGEISPRRIWHEIRQAVPGQSSDGAGAETFLKELGWREFAHHLLFHFPNTAAEPLRDEFSRFPWREDPQSLNAWQRGETGYPIVDAGMRELWATGWMHNRVRMIVASFLVKDLLIPWQRGAEWFWDTLVDADLASNTLGWQWTAGCGADAAPYFRIFNPTLQSEKFDSEGQYIRRWIPELQHLSGRWIHAPWTAPAEVLTDARITLGSTYPAACVEHRAARDRALECFQRLKTQRAASKRNSPLRDAREHGF